MNHMATLASMQSVLNLGSASSQIRKARKQFICRHCKVAFKRGEHLARHERARMLPDHPVACTYFWQTLPRDRLRVLSATQPSPENLLVRHQRMCAGAVAHRQAEAEAEAEAQKPRASSSSPTPAAGSPSSHSATQTSPHPESPNESNDVAMSDVPDTNGSTETQISPNNMTTPGMTSNSGEFNSITIASSQADSRMRFSVLDYPSQAPTPYGSLDLSEFVSITSPFSSNLYDMSFLEDPQINVSTQKSLPQQSPVSLQSQTRQADTSNPPSLSAQTPAQAHSTPGQIINRQLLGVSDEQNSPPLEVSLSNRQRRGSHASVSSRTSQASHSPITSGSELTATPPFSSSSIGFDDDCRANLLANLSQIGAMHGMSEVLSLTSSHVFKRFLSSYLTGLDRHLPFIHATFFRFEFLRLPPQPWAEGDIPLETIANCILTLAVAAIGALHCLERKKGRYMRDWCRKYLSVMCCTDQLMTDDRTLGIEQAQLLCSMFDAWSADRELVEYSLNEQFFFARCIVRGLPLRQVRVVTDWRTWTIRESYHRLYWTFFVLMSDMNITFNQVIPLRLNELGLLLPESDEVWQAATEEEWNQRLLQSAPPSTIDHVVMWILNGPGNSNGDDEVGEMFPAMPRSIIIDDREHKLSLFSVYIVMHCVVNHLWTADQVLQFGFIRDTPATMELEYLRTLTFKQQERILTRSSERLLAVQASCDVGTYPSPMVFNACALIRVMQVRQFRVTSSMNNILCDPDLELNLDKALYEFLSRMPRRGGYVNKAIAAAVDVIHIPVKAGHLLIKRMAAVHWSVEHALCGWDSILFLTSWLHGVELAYAVGGEVSEEERSIVERVKELIEESNVLQDDDIDESLITNDDPFSLPISLAATVADLWASMLDDTWVWGITVRMATILRSLGNKFRENNPRCKTS